MPPSPRTPGWPAGGARAVRRDRAGAWPPARRRSGSSVPGSPRCVDRRRSVTPNSDRELGRPHLLVGVPPRPVGPQQRADRRAQHHERAAGLGAQEGADRRGEVARPRGPTAEQGWPQCSAPHRGVYFDQRGIAEVRVDLARAPPMPRAAAVAPRRRGRAKRRCTPDRRSRSAPARARWRAPPGDGAPRRLRPRRPADPAVHLAVLDLSERCRAGEDQDDVPHRVNRDRAVVLDRGRPRTCAARSRPAIDAVGPPRRSCSGSPGRWRRSRRRAPPQCVAISTMPRTRATRCPPSRLHSQRCRSRPRHDQRDAGDQRHAGRRVAPGGDDGPAHPASWDWRAADQLGASSRSSASRRSSGSRPTSSTGSESSLICPAEGTPRFARRRGA